MTRSTIVPALVAALLAAPAAFSGDSCPHGHGKDGPPRGAKLFKKMDADGDGQVTRAEFLAAHEKHFDRLDADGDGILTHDELKAARHHKHGKKDAPEDTDAE
ncbi:MAG: hypothetical protein KatS3mg121_0141 [Gammaproteobacteria bacterium]|nr:MAG: hypothetical protein KatS3mg121_0141 [Gammaproteobacteria bacterium]